jgi:hypothetical protein
MKLESLFDFDEEVTVQNRPGIIVAIRFTKMKVFYDVLDIYHSVIIKEVPSEDVTN